MTEFEQESLRERGRVLTGKYAHWCWDWDDMTMDETCPEWPCACARDLMAEREGAADEFERGGR